MFLLTLLSFCLESQIFADDIDFNAHNSGNEIVEKITQRVQ